MQQPASRLASQNNQLLDGKMQRQDFTFNRFLGSFVILWITHPHGCHRLPPQARLFTAIREASFNDSITARFTSMTAVECGSACLSSKNCNGFAVIKGSLGAGGTCVFTANPLSLTPTPEATAFSAWSKGRVTHFSFYCSICLTDFV